MLELNHAIRGMAVEGTVRPGLPSDLAETWLLTTLDRFKRAHPAVLIEAVVERNAVWLEQIDKGRLDLVLAFGGEEWTDALRCMTISFAPLSVVLMPFYILGDDALAVSLKFSEHSLRHDNV
ncbi:LysR substrate-binding domain-containing protein [Bradyrhizobium aeschynomenes]|nr:LysR substrate-binding domain-containing protein [Bradyrhizobium aeschynomenes]